MTFPTDGRPLAVFTHAPWDRWSREMAKGLALPDVKEALSDFARVDIDADLRPDLARRLAPGGIPTLALLTPDGAPMVATGYTPPRTLREFARAASVQWHVRAPMLADQARKAQASAREMALFRPRPGPVDDAFVRAAIEDLVESCDPISPGWGEGTRPVHAASLRLLAARPDIAEGREVLSRVLGAMQRGEIRDASGGFSHAADIADFNAPDGVEIITDLVDLHAAYLRAADVERRADFAETAHGLAKRLEALRGADGMWPVAVTSEDGVRHIATAEASFRAASVFRGRPEALSFAAALTDAESGLFRRRADDASRIFYFADQAAALAALAHRDPAAARVLADTVIRVFWDETAAAFRDRFGPPLELAPLDSPQLPVDDNALAAGALASLGGAHAELARRAISSFTDAFIGHGHASARLALAVCVFSGPDATSVVS